MQLPRSISDLKLSILKVIAQEPDGIFHADICSNLLAHPNNRHSIQFIKKTISNMPASELVVREATGGGRPSKYHLSELGEAVLANIDSIPVTKAQEGAAGQKRSKQTAMPFAPPPEPAHTPINVSETANNVVDHIADLVEENRRYRALMIDLHRILTRELGLDAPTINGEPVS